MRGRVHAISAPVGGWNARDSKDQMAEEDAVVLDNWFPGEGEVSLRKGYTQHATGLGGNVETIAEYHAGTNRKLLACANGNIWNATSSGAAASLASGFVVNRWQWANFNGSIGFVNGTDAPQKYDGSTVTALSITGPTATSLIGINVFKSRTYFWEVNSQSFWYSAVNALGGTLTEFPLSRVSQFGGNLQTMATWTRDGGNGPDDFAVFIMSSGDVVVYQGSDPGSSTDWSLVGIYKIGAPIGRRCTMKVGGDLIVITKDGFVPLNGVLATGRVSNKGAVSDKIRGAVKTAAQSYGDSYGWQAILYPRGNYAFVNIPITTNTTYHQYVMNTITGAWCRFKGMDARSWGVYDDRLYFGGNGIVYLADNGASDGGSDIQGDAQTAFTYLRNRSRQKQLTTVQPVMSSEGSLPIAASSATDFATPAINYNTSSFTGNGTQWDTAQWDTFEWGGGDGTIVNEWISAGGIGYNFSLRVRVAVSAQAVKWYSTNYMYKLGGLV